MMPVAPSKVHGVAKESNCETAYGSSGRKAAGCTFSLAAPHPTIAPEIATRSHLLARDTLRSRDFACIDSGSALPVDA
jgi:hypothetical protein